MAGSVSYVVEGGIAIVTIDNSARLNAIDRAIADGLAATLAALEQRDDIGAVLLRGAGTKAFSAGVDLKAAEASGDREAEFERIDRAMRAIERSFAAMPMPSVAMLSGVCYGGGVQLSSMADFRVASADLRLAVPAIPNRLFYPIPALERLAALMGWANARRLIFDSGPHDAPTLLQWGLIDRIAEPAAIESAARTHAAALAAKPREIMRDYRPILAALERGDRAEAERLRREAKAREAARRAQKSRGRE